MAYSQELLERIRAVLADRTDVVEKKMFVVSRSWSVAAWRCGPHGDRLIVRIGNEAAKKYIGRPHVKPMDFTGKVLNSFAMIEPEGIRTDLQLHEWVLMAADFAIQAAGDNKAGRRRSSHRGK